MPVNIILHAQTDRLFVNREKLAPMQTLRKIRPGTVSWIATRRAGMFRVKSVRRGLTSVERGAHLDDSFI